MTTSDLHTAISAARAAIPSAAHLAHEAAVRHAALRVDLVELLVIGMVPGAAVLVFDRDEDAVTGATLIELVHVRAGDGTLQWFNVHCRFAHHPDAQRLGMPPPLDQNGLDAVAVELREAYDAYPGRFHPVGDGVEVMAVAHLLALPIRHRVNS